MRNQFSLRKSPLNKHSKKYFIFDIVQRTKIKLIYGNNHVIELNCEQLLCLTENAFVFYDFWSTTDILNVRITKFK